ncbi:MAG TPA: D-alanyl-D-alanine carboxypeptidase [Actinomycetota bacterium]|nr:D-alanyl-D-alanine carboxypeptidase [Actinomycetota bacterium]
MPSAIRLFVLVTAAIVLATAVTPLPDAAARIPDRHRNEEGARPRDGHRDEQRLQRGPAPRAWARRIDRMVDGLPVGIAVREGGTFLYRHRATQLRTPASNEKLLLAMALLNRLGPDATIPTQAAAAALPTAGILAGDLWILGQGNPAVGPAAMAALARAVVTAGVTQIQGSVVGSMGYFRRDWQAPGWRRYFPRTEIPLPTALTFEGNVDRGVHIRDPELRAARALTADLRELGVRVAGEADARLPPDGLLPVAQVESPRLIELVEFTTRYSSNFYAEVLGKRLGVEHAGAPGSIPKGAAAMRAWAAAGGARARARDASGLSYANRISPIGLVRLLGVAEMTAWGEVFREALPQPGQGTMKGRLRGVPVHAKTGTLTEISALSGWVFARRARAWIEFSIMSEGLPKDVAVNIEDRVVRMLRRFAA